MRSIVYFNGIFLVVLSLCMIPPLLADLYFGYSDWRIFFMCLLVTLFFGGCMLLGNTGSNLNISRKQIFLLTATCWLNLSCFASLPFILSSSKLSFINAFFESVSGLTTTGATVITNLDHTSAGILMWRAILQWLGGIVTIFMAISILPLLKIGGMNIFRTELSAEAKAIPHTTQKAQLILLVYFSLTLFCMIGYMIMGMEVFDAIAHAMTTVSTGGFSTYDQSFLHFNNIGIELIAVIFMILGSLPFLLYLTVMNGDFYSLIRNVQVRLFFAFIFISCFILLLYFLFFTPLPHLNALRYALFSTVSIITGTGFYTMNLTPVGSFYNTALLFLMVIGGCAGSTTGGIKIFRFHILYNVTINQIHKLILPHRVKILRYNAQPLSNDIPASVMGFLFIYALSFVVLALTLTFTGLEFSTAFSSAIASISNVGSGFGIEFTHGNTYQNLDPIAKIALCLGMLMGRLELFILLVILSPKFWEI